MTVLDKQLEGKEFIIGDELTVADISIHPWVECLEINYKVQDKVELSSFKNVVAWRDRLNQREGFKKGKIAHQK